MNGNAKLVRMGCLLLSMAVVCLGGCSSTVKSEPEGKSAKVGAEQAVAATVRDGGKQAAGAVAVKDGTKPAVSEAVPELCALSGKVVETMSVSNYSYVCLENSGKKEWAAIPLGKIQVGAVMNLRPGMVMHDFHSKSLNRTFDRIVFSEGPVLTAQAQPGTHKQ